MSSCLVVHDSVSLPRNKKRSPLLTPRHLDAAPIPPTLVHSHHLSSPDSIFRRRTSVPRWPSRGSDEWLRDMVPMDGSLADTKSEGSDSSTPSPTSSESSHSFLFFPPSPMLRPRSTGPDAPTPGKLGLCGPGLGQSPHS